MFPETFRRRLSLANKVLYKSDLTLCGPWVVPLIILCCGHHAQCMERVCGQQSSAVWSRSSTEISK